MRSLIFAALLGSVALAGCKKVEQGPAQLEHPHMTLAADDVYKTAQPDEHGVVCYMYQYSSDSVSCVQVQPPTQEQP